MDGKIAKRLEFNSVCRLCVRLLETEKVSPIFNNEIYAERVSLPERIRYCSSVEVHEGDGLPSKICSSCLLKLNQSFVFRNQCVLADNTLKRLIRDVTLNMNEISHFVNVDIENQAIQFDDIGPNRNFHINTLQNIDFEKGTTENRANEGNIDEFDNSKNGRHKRNINKFKDKSIQRAKIYKNGMSRSNNIDLELYNETHLNTVDEECNEVRKGKKRKGKFKCEKKCWTKDDDTSDEELFGNENRFKLKTRKKSKGKKFEEEIEIKNEIKEEMEEESQEVIENFTVEPDVFAFDEPKRESDGACEKVTTRDEQQQSHVKKLKNVKMGAAKRGRPRKYSAIKEKPSSYTCDYCQKVYPSEGGWRYHIHTMHNENYQPFICDLCGKAFKVKKNLEGHKNSIHYHLKHHLCDLCGRGFASKYALKVHKIWHNDEKNFPCDVCGTKFRTKGKMNTHRTIHGGPKKFMCHVCSRDFRWKKDFEIHMRTHTGEKPFKCSHCGKAFSSLTNMKKHERNHVGKLRTNCATEIYDTSMTEIPGDVILYKTEPSFQYNCGVDDGRSHDFN